jgi:hypothetical protein
VEEEEVASFMSLLEDIHAAGIDDLNFDDHEHEPTTEQGEVAEEEVEEVEVEEIQTSAKKSRASNYSEKEDVTLCYAWMNVWMHMRCVDAYVDDYVCLNSPYVFIV